MAKNKSTKAGITLKLLIAMIVSAVIPFCVLVGVTGLEILNSMGGMVSAVALGMGLLIAWGIYHGIMRQIHAIEASVLQLASGALEQRVDVFSNDELGSIADAINIVAENARSAQTTLGSVRESNKGVDKSNNQNSTESNLVVNGQLQEIVRQVQVTTDYVNYSAHHMRQSSNELSQDNDQQANAIGQASGKLLEMTEAFQNVAARTEESVQVAIEARQTAAEGLKAVNDTVEGMQRIRAQVQNTSKRIKRLGESSQEIGEIVQLISDIADRTSILALNASIQAAMAGDAGQGFAVVAEEVERLAERSAAATGQIASLIRGIQTETGEVISDMEESTREVVNGSQLATEAGETLFEIDSVSNQLVQLIENVSQSARAQAQDATTVAASMAEISSETKQSAERSLAADKSVDELTQLAAKLQESVSRFTGQVEPENSMSGSSHTEHAVQVLDEVRSVSNLLDSSIQTSPAAPLSGVPATSVPAGLVPPAPASSSVSNDA